MPNKPDVPCAVCGNLMWSSSTSLPPGRATCLQCRRANPRSKNRRGTCIDCGESCSSSHAGERCYRCAMRRRYPNGNKKDRGEPHFKFKVRPCAACGEDFRPLHVGSQTGCSRPCRAYLKKGPWVVPLPRTHPVWRELRARRPKKKYYIPRPDVSRTCAWCGDGFTTHLSTQRFCSKTCGHKNSRAARKGREFGWVSNYTWTEVMRLFLLFNRRCAYCEQSIDGQPEPDHVVALSRGGCNSITNILPSCSLCNSDKRNLLLDEWGADRERRKMPPRLTVIPVDDPRFRHLILFQRSEAA